MTLQDRPAFSTTTLTHYILAGLVLFWVGASFEEAWLELHQRQQYLVHLFSSLESAYRHRLRALALQL